MQSVRGANVKGGPDLLTYQAMFSYTSPSPIGDLIVLGWMLRTQPGNPFGHKQEENLDL